MKLQTNTDSVTVTSESVSDILALTKLWQSTLGGAPVPTTKGNQDVLDVIYPTQCSVCTDKRVFKYRGHYATHLRNFHSKVGIKRHKKHLFNYPCPHCTRPCKGKIGLANHSRKCAQQPGVQV